MFLGLEIMSLALYALCGSALGRRAATSFRPWLMRQVAMCSKGKDPPQTYATGTCTEDKSIA